jgi:hypothetical protein
MRTKTRWNRFFVVVYAMGVPLAVINLLCDLMISNYGWYIFDGVGLAFFVLQASLFIFRNPVLE